MNATPQIVETAEAMSQLASEIDVPKAVVMTMGGLHSGHGDLMDIAREKVGPTGHVTVTIFVNPLQFAVNEDLGKYPRTFDDDVAMCRERGVDVVFAPTQDEIYPHGEPRITVDPGELGLRYEGVDRPTHFRGVLTVVSILMQITKPDFAIFGEKDYQQLTLVRQMVDELRLGVEIVPGPTAREESGLAMSSRNKYLSDVARQTALRMPQAIQAGVAAGPGGADAVVTAATEVLKAPGAQVSIEPAYVVVTNPQMGPAPETGPARLILTAVVDGTRLLDNADVFLGQEPTQ